MEKRVEDLEKLAIAQAEQLRAILATLQDAAATITAHRRILDQHEATIAALTGRPARKKEIH